MTGNAADPASLLELLYAAPVGLVQTTADGEISLINSVSARLLLPLSPNGRLNNLYAVLAGVAPGLRERVAAHAPAHGMVCEGLRLEVRPDPGLGRETQFISISVKKLGADSLIAVLLDITVQVRREQQLLQSQAWSHAVLAGISDHGVGTLDGEGRFVDWNEGVGPALGYRRAEVLGRPYSIFYPAGAITADGLRDRLREADQGGWSLDEGWRLRADGSRFWGSTMIVPARTAAAGAYSLVLRDITEQRESLDQHRRAGASDHLTGIANRRRFFEAAELELQRWRRAPRPLSLIIFDADHFKRINDRYGHAAGDAVLRHLAERLTSTFRQVDVPSRIGGEEFAVLLPSAGLEEARAVAERLRQAVAAEPVLVDGRSICYTVSGGVAMMDASVQSLAELMKRADQALYAAKGAGRDRIECHVPEPGRG
jgi:diguanylate cyclase (GGDEF)-like protein/PAS domain S-box-containing protein